MLKTFTGFKGKIAFAEIGGVSFVLMAKNDRQLCALWSHIMQSVPLDPRGIKPAIVIESNLLPDKKNPTKTHHQ
jgi:hypothetical protein